MLAAVFAPVAGQRVQRLHPDLLGRVPQRAGQRRDALGTSAGKMATANVSQTCGWLQGRGAAVAAPEIMTSPAKHSGITGHRAPAARDPMPGNVRCRDHDPLA